MVTCSRPRRCTQSRKITSHLQESEFCRLLPKRTEYNERCSVTEYISRLCLGLGAKTFLHTGGREREHDSVQGKKELNKTLLILCRKLCCHCREIRHKTAHKRKQKNTNQIKKTKVQRELCCAREPGGNEEGGKDAEGITASTLFQVNLSDLFFFDFLTFQRSRWLRSVALTHTVAKTVAGLLTLAWKQKLRSSSPNWSSNEGRDSLWRMWCSCN